MSETWVIEKNSHIPPRHPQCIYITTETAKFGEEIAVIYSGNLEHAHLLKAAPKMRDALEQAYEFIRSEYGDPEAQALEGEYVSKGARPVWSAICDALGEASWKEPVE